MLQSADVNIHVCHDVELDFLEDTFGSENSNVKIFIVGVLITCYFENEVDFILMCTLLVPWWCSRPLLQESYSVCPQKGQFSVFTDADICWKERKCNLCFYHKMLYNTVHISYDISLSVYSFNIKEN